MTLIVCTYNNAASLDVTLESIRQQTDVPGLHWETIVVDNNCTDATADVLRAAQSVSNRLRIVQETEQGLTPARRCGVQAACSDWIAFVDDDCALDPDWLSEAMRFLEAHPTCGGFGGQVVLDFERVPPPWVEPFRYCFAEQQRGDESHRTDWLVGTGMVLSRQVLLATGWVDDPLLPDRIGDRLVSGGDVEIASRVGALEALWYVPACRLQHRIPARRVTLPYLIRMNHGLGASAVLVHCMCSGQQSRRWLRDAASTGVSHLQQSLPSVARALAARGSWRVAILRLAFCSGWWSTMGALCTTRNELRRRLVSWTHPVAPASSAP